MAQRKWAYQKVKSYLRYSKEIVAKGVLSSKQNQQKINIVKRKVIVNYLRLWNVVKSTQGKSFIKSFVCVTETESSCLMKFYFDCTTRHTPAINSSHFVYLFAPWPQNFGVRALALININQTFSLMAKVSHNDIF